MTLQESASAASNDNLRYAHIIARERVRRPASLSPAPDRGDDPEPEPAPILAPNKPDGPPSAVADYEIGYRKPPKKHQFKKGQSGNPKGRPKGAKGVKTIDRKLLSEKVIVRTSGGKVKMRKVDAMLHKLAELAFTGNIRATKMLIDLFPEEDLPERGQVGSAAEPPIMSDEHDRAILEALRHTLLAA